MLSLSNRCFGSPSRIKHNEHRVIAQSSSDQTRLLNYKTTQNSKNPALLAEGLNTKGKWHIKHVNPPRLQPAIQVK
jgi:hypothetical protein